MTTGHFSSCITHDDCWCEAKRYWLLLAIATVILFTEVVGGVLSHSLALLADAGHVLADTGATVVAIIVAYKVKKSPHVESKTRKIGGYINAIFLGVIGIWIFIEAIERFFNPHPIVSMTMIVVAILGTIGNYIQHAIMESANAEHVTHESMKLHILSDLLQSIGVVLGGVIIWATGWDPLDPIISVVIAILMARWSWSLLLKLRSGKYDNGSHCHHHH